MEKDAYYFPHDSNARNDLKIKQMRSVYKGEGFGWYWILVEMLRETANYKLSIEGKYIWNAFAEELQCDADKAKQFINDCIDEFHLFDSDGISFWSNSLFRRMQKKDEKSEKARESARSRWSKNRNANAMPTHSESNAKRIEESKVEEIKEEIINNDDDSASENFVTVYEQEFGRLISPADADIFVAFIEQDKLPEELIVEAIKRSRKQGVCKASYAASILKGWKDKGVVNLSGVQRVDEEFEKHKKSKVRPIRSPGTTRPGENKDEKYKDVYMS